MITQREADQAAAILERMAETVANVQRDLEMARAAVSEEIERIEREFGSALMGV